MTNRGILDQLSILDSAELSDALDSLGVEGAILGIKTLVPGKKLVGRAFTVKYKAYSENQTSFKNAGNYIDEAPEGSVLLIDNAGKQDCTVWGDILTTMAKVKSLSGTVVYGSVRDVEQVKKLDYPVFSSGVYMRSGKNRVKKVAHQVKINISGIMVNPGDYIFGDDNGILVIPAELVEKVVTRAKAIKESEEKIMLAIKSGQSLLSAREQYRYDQPWLEAEK